MLKKQKVIARILTVTVLLSNVLIPMEKDRAEYKSDTIVKAEETINSDFVITDGVLTKYTGNERDIVIPDGVVTIAVGVFSNRSITSVTIPSSVTTISKQAFYKCNSLRSVTLSEGLVKIGEEAFAYCGFSAVLLPSTLTSIGKGAFLSSNLIHVVLPDGITSISEQAFMNCDDLTNITFSNTLEKIGEQAFTGCGELTQIKIPEGVKSISSYAFSGCDKLMSVTLPSNLEVIEEYAFYSCDTLPTIEIPNSVKRIGQCAFSGCKGLVRITLSDQITNLAFATFSGCYSLMTITIPTSVVSIEDKVFYSCPGLGVVNIPENVQAIQSGSFDKTDTLEIHGYFGSYAEIYAKKEKISFVGETKPTPEPTVQPSKEPVLVVEPIPTLSVIPGETTTVEPIVPTTVPSILPTQAPIEENKIDTENKNAQVSLEKTTYYTTYGKKVEPKVTVKYNNETLRIHRDYSLVYKNNKSYGKAKVIVIGQGEYTGTVTCTFYILPKKASIVNGKVCKYKGNKVVKVTWKKSKGVLGYQILYAKTKNGKYRNATRKDVDVTSAIFSFSGKKIYIKMRAYITISGKYKYGQYSKVKEIKLK